MKYIMVLLISEMCLSQVQHFELGLSAGGVFEGRIGYGQVDIIDGEKVGPIVTGSVWMFEFTNPQPHGEEGYFSWLTPTDKTFQRTGYSLGLLYLDKGFAAGVTFDYLRTITFQNYTSSVTGMDWHTAGKNEDKYGLSVTGSAFISDHLWVTASVGLIKPVILGLAYSFGPE